MNLVLLISVLIGSGLCSLNLDVKRDIRVHGTLTCSHPFYYRVRMVERDDIGFDELIAEGEVTYANGSASYDLSGWGSDSVPWFLVWTAKIEPVVTIFHTCQPSCYSSKDYCCACKEWDTRDNIDEEINVDLDKPHLGGSCANCKIGEHLSGKKTWGFPEMPKK